MTRKYPHPKGDDLYTPFGPALEDLFERMKLEHGTWRRVCWITNTRLKVMRQMRRGKRKAISMRKLDEMITATKVGHLDEFTWFTAEDLVRLGIWKDVEYAVGKSRVRLENDNENGKPE
jgi:hypothetical protein